MLVILQIIPLAEYIQRQQVSSPRCRNRHQIHEVAMVPVSNMNINQKVIQQPNILNCYTYNSLFFIVKKWIPTNAHDHFKDASH